MVNNKDLERIGPLRSKAEIEAKESARLDAELAAMARAQAAPAPPKSDLVKAAEDQQRRYLSQRSKWVQYSYDRPGSETGSAETRTPVE